VHLHLTPSTTHLTPWTACKSSPNGPNGTLLKDETAQQSRAPIVVTRVPRQMLASDRNHTYLKLYKTDKFFWGGRRKWVRSWSFQRHINRNVCTSLENFRCLLASMSASLQRFHVEVITGRFLVTLTWDGYLWYILPDETTDVTACEGPTTAEGPRARLGVQNQRLRQRFTPLSHRIQQSIVALAAHEHQDSSYSPNVS
jgi:hypothetical protein